MHMQYYIVKLFWKNNSLSGALGPWQGYKCIRGEGPDKPMATYDNRIDSEYILLTNFTLFRLGLSHFRVNYTLQNLLCRKWLGGWLLYPGTWMYTCLSCHKHHLTILEHTTL